jgi:mono/diheme cytochrome c family protein
VPAPPAVDRGEYLVKISGCNDCHTPGYNERNGRVPVSEWLTGVAVGFRGPWGTSYPSNLRLTIRSMSEDEWLTFARARRLPPMPWFALEAMTDADLRSMYRFIYSLGPQGVRAPAALPPGAKSANPYIPFVAQTAKR